ncbi:hypothetical protein Ssi03_41970 [Sphaerisporangium siamense]|uniref:Uncharacterized protein n=1 Tax=Sphaerisporangium siamense TaxID=795645 RepID=A0A7W7DD48_9ACTN|nr:hypothetical protein [Sphaerisporangium siamense]MBB4704593.1 hypothetical protein [Sphaerisporangium siamense]GII86207.1 hypothetical protein Ssi03_41970 [Sphaerisporangium siamense]
MDVPGIDDPSWRDIISMRLDDDAFALWQRHVSLGSQESMTLRSLGHFVDSRRCVSDALTKGRVHLLRARRASKFLHRMGRSSIMFTLGSLGGAVGASFGGLTASAFGAAGGGIGAALPSLVVTDDRVQNRLAPHYLAFELPRP